MYNSATGWEPRVVEYGSCSQEHTTVYCEEGKEVECGLRSVNNLSVNIHTIDPSIAW